MSSFLAMIWTPDDRDAARATLEFLGDKAMGLSKRLIFETAGFCLTNLLAEREGPDILPIDTFGAVYGTLFARPSSLVPSPRLTRISSEAATAIRASSGNCLLTEYWGNYVAFIRSGEVMTVIADPTSSIPCFYTERGPVTFVFSHMERCPASLRRGLTVNRRFASHLLAYDKIQNGETGLNEVRELQGGHCLNIGRAAKVEVLAWDPRELARTQQDRSVEDAAEELRQTARYVVRSHGSSVPAVALNVSGGLDSAIVAALMTEAGDHLDIQGVHFVLDGGDPAETKYARALAASIGLRLTEINVDPHRPLPAPDQYPLTVRPYREFLGQALLADQSNLPVLNGRVTFTGQGGDHLFLETRTPFVFADYLRGHGAGRETFHELLNAARLSGNSVWQVLQDVAPSVVGMQADRLDFFAGLRDRNTRVNRLAHERLDPAELLPVWARKPRGVPPAKFGQIVGLVHMFQIRNALPPARRAPLVHPLISQPLIEFCLRTPTYQLCAGGIPRGLARLAMKGLIPDEVRWRRSKGDASRFFIEQLSANHALLSETLLHGELVAGGFVDPDDIKACLAPEAFRTQTFGRMILIYYVIECWLRRWKSEMRSV